MQVQKKAAFSPSGEFFAFADCQGVLRIWDTASNSVKKQHALHSVDHSCSSLAWSPAEGMSSGGESGDGRQCLAVGTESGQVLLYDMAEEQFCNHFVTAQSDAVTDLCWCPGTSSLFSCSKDKSIAVWDAVSGKLKSKWQADDEPLHSICVIDDENLLSASTSILWWNIKDQTVIKKFIGQDTEILTLLPAISTEKSCNSYFLSVAAGDLKINAWLLHTKNSLNAVASFDLPDDLVGMDVTRHFSKKKPMYLSAVTKNGALLLFKHVLNGKARKNLLPQSTLRVASKPTDDTSTTASSPLPILAAKILNDSCVIAYGETKNLTFERVDISNCPKMMTLLARDVVCNDSSEISQVKIYNKLGEYISANGTAPYSSPKKKRKQKDPDENFAPTHAPASTDEKADRRRHDVILSDPRSIADSLVRGIQTQDRAALNMVVLCSDEDLIRQCVALLPPSCLPSLLAEMQRRLLNEEERCIYSSRKWLKEILSHNLQFLRKHKDMEDILKQIKDFIDKQRVSETLTKLTKLKGLLNLQRIQQHRPVGDSDEDME